MNPAAVPQTLFAMPIDYSDYPPNWKSEIVPRIRARDNDTCTRCGRKENRNPAEGEPQVKCGVAHLDHNEWVWDAPDDRLAVMCDPCHFNYDRPDNIRRAKYGKKYKKTLIEIPFPDYEPTRSLPESSKRHPGPAPGTPHG